MLSNLKKKMALLLLFLALVVLALPGRVSAQVSSQAQALRDQQTQLQQQLAEIEKQIAQYEQELTGVQSQKNTLNNKIKQLKTKQSQLALQIKETNLKIQNVGGQLDQTWAQISQTQEQIVLLKQQLAAIILRVAQMDQNSLIYILAGSDNFSDFYDQWYVYQALNASVGQILDALKDQQAGLENDKQLLTDQMAEQENYLNIIDLQKNQLTQNIQSQNTLLTETKGKESSYQSIIKVSKAQVAEIRSRIYNLLGVSQKVTFGEALVIAKWANAQTGVRPAFLLAILTQESNLGKNVGTCNRLGDPPEKSWKVIMKPERDQQPFLKITEALGMDPDITPVSCPMRDKSGQQIGWGGAMGPAQFIPSTWLGYQAKVTAVTGKAANPWDIRDAFLAAAIKLKADGATAPGGEWAAAMRYFSGGTNTAYRFYGDNVMAIAEGYQGDIEELN